MIINASKVIRAVANPTRITVTAPVWKEDYGRYLLIEGIDLPEAYEIDFSNEERGGTSITMVGNAEGVQIPTQFIKSGRDVFAFYYYVGEDYGKTVYKFRIPNRLRPDRTTEQPTPEEQNLIDQAIAALNIAVDKSETNVTHYPLIIDNYWHVWDAEHEEFVNTDVQALGTSPYTVSLYFDTLYIPCDKDGKCIRTMTATFRFAGYIGENAAGCTVRELTGKTENDPLVDRNLKLWLVNAFDTQTVGQFCVKYEEGTDPFAGGDFDDYRCIFRFRFDDGRTRRRAIHIVRVRQGEKGETGNSGVYIGTDEPTDTDVNVWVDTDGQPDSVTGLKYVKDDPSDHGGVIEGWVTLPENPPPGMYINTASGNYSHAEGYGTIASGQWSHSENAFTMADGEAAHAEGYMTEAHGADAHSEGQYTKARSHASHAEGVSTVAIGTATHAEGYGTKASSNYQHVQGKYNVVDSNNTYAMIIGNGTDDSNRSNAFAIKWDGTMVLANGSEIQPNEMAVCYHISSLYQEQGSTNIVGDIIGTFDPTLPKGKTILMSYEGECYYYSTSYFSYIDYHVWSTPVMYDKTDTTTPRLFVKTFTSYDLQKFTFKKVYLDELVTTTTRGFMSATDKQHLDSVYADYSSALTALGVI